MIINNSYDVTIDKFLQLASQTRVFNGRDYLKTSKVIELMTLAYWTLIYKTPIINTLTVDSLKKITKSFEDYLNKKLNVRLMSRLNNHLMIEWRRSFYYSFYKQNCAENDLIKFLTECLVHIENEQCYLIDYNPLSSTNYEFKSEIENEAKDFIDELNNCLE